VSSSNAYLNCRIEWHRSRLLCASLACLGLLAALAVLLSALSLWMAVPLALAVAARGLWLAWAEYRCPVAHLHIESTEQGLCLWLDGRPARLLRVKLRGTVAVLELEAAGRRHRLGWWPDTLTPAIRRTLRLLTLPHGTPPAALPLVAG
jgi:toxin CptA